MAVVVAVAMAVGYNARHLIRHMRVCARHRRALRACSPFPVPSAHERHAHVAAAVALARARSIACTRCGVAMAVEVAVGCTAYDMRHSRCASLSRTRVIIARRARHHRFPFPLRTTGTRAWRLRRRSLARSIARGGGRSRRASRTPLITRVHARTRARNHRALRASSPFPFPDVTHTLTRAHGNGGGALLFARTHGGVGSGGGGCGGGGAGGAAEGVWRAHWRMRR